MNNLLEINPKNQEIFFNFGGFYNSNHLTLIESNLESVIDNSNHLTLIESNLESVIDNIDDQKIKEFKKDQLFDFENTKMNYTKALLKLIDDKFDTNFFQCFKGIWSPKEYNFATDQIILDFQNFSFKDDKTINKIATFLINIENYADLEFEIVFFKLDSENLKKFIDDNLNLDSEILETILDNFGNIKEQNFCDFDEFKQYLVEVYDGEVIYHYTALEFLKDYDPSLKISLKLASNLGLDLKNLNSEILASLLKQDIFRDLVDDDNEDLKIIFELLENQ